MAFADEVAAALKPALRCKTCIVLADVKDRDEIQKFLMENPSLARRAALALKARGISVSEGSVRNHVRERHEL